MSHHAFLDEHIVDNTDRALAVASFLEAAVMAIAANDADALTKDACEGLGYISLDLVLLLQAINTQAKEVGAT